MFKGQIYYQGNPITIEKAVELDLVEVDENKDIWLKNDVMRLVKITGDLKLG